MNLRKTVPKVVVLIVDVETARNDGHRALQGHSRAPISVTGVWKTLCE